MAQLRVKRTSEALGTKKLLPGELGLAGGKFYIGAGTGDDEITPTQVLLAGQDATIDNLTVGGNLTVNGTTTVIDTTNLQVEDRLIVLNKSNIGSASIGATAPVGIVLSGAGDVSQGGPDLILGANSTDGRIKVIQSRGETGIWGSAKTIAYTDDIPTVKITTSGDGNVITGGTYSNGTITLNKDAKAALVTDSIVDFQGIVTAELIRSKGYMSADGDLDVGGNLAVTGSATVGGKNVSLEDHTHADATTTTSGFMSVDDKRKLNNISMPSGQEQGAKGYVVPPLNPNRPLDAIAQDTMYSSIAPLGILKDGATSAIVLYGKDEFAVVGLANNKIKIARYNFSEHGPQGTLKDILTSNLAEEINNIDCGIWE